MSNSLYLVKADFQCYAISEISCYLCLISKNGSKKSEKGNKT